MKRRVRVGGIKMVSMRMMMVIAMLIGKQEGVWGMWCVARSDASDADLQKGLDYACAAGADCAPIQQNGLCYLPNTLQAHASYAYNSYYQRSNSAPGSCHFSNTATLAKTDPSYGSCVYPASPSTAGTGTGTGGTSSSSGGIGGTPTNPNITPATTATTNSPTAIYGGGGGGGGFIPTAMGPPISTTTDSRAPTPLSPTTFSLLLLFSITLSSLL